MLHMHIHGVRNSPDISCLVERFRQQSVKFTLDVFNKTRSNKKRHGDTERPTQRSYCGSSCSLVRWKPISWEQWRTRLSDWTSQTIQKLTTTHRPEENAGITIDIYSGRKERRLRVARKQVKHGTVMIKNWVYMLVNQWPCETTDQFKMHACAKNRHGTAPRVSVAYVFRSYTKPQRISVMWQLILRIPLWPIKKARQSNIRATNHYA